MAPEARQPAQPLPRFGLILDGGVPDGLGLSGVFRPLPWVRAHLGVTQGITPGVRLGGSLVPFTAVLTPSLTLEAGHVLEGNLGALLRRFRLKVDHPALDRFGYSYANAHLGLELGAPERFVFFTRLGISYVHIVVRDFSAGGEVPLSASPIYLRATLPSLKLGFLLYFG